MPYEMFVPLIARARRTVVLLTALLSLFAASCVSTVDDDFSNGSGETDAGPDDPRVDPQTAAGSSSAPTDGLPDALAFASGSQLLGRAAPGGTPFASCSIDYRAIDWSGDPQSVVADHTAASTPNCIAESWYGETAFQNGILGFMVLVGEETLAGAAPASAEAAVVAESLRQQGFDRLAGLEIISSGHCGQGEVQAAVFSLSIALPAGGDLPGYAAIAESAEASGAVVDRRDGYTVITGGGAPCATAIVQRDRILAWVTAPDVETLEAVVASL